MANTIVQLKYSTVAGNTPSSLANGEIAINSSDGILFYSTPNGSVRSFTSGGTGPSGLDTEIQFNDAGSMGGSDKLTFNKTTGQLTVSGTVRANLFSDDGTDLYDFSNRAFNQANAAFAAANSGSGQAGAYNQANAAFDTANAAFIRANNSVNANLGGTIAATTAATSNISGALIVSGGVGIKGNVYTGSIVLTGNGVGGLSNTITFPDGTVQNSSPVTIGNYANSAFANANGAFAKANASFAYANGAYTAANLAFNQANASFNTANAAFIRANNSLDANNGGTVTGNLTLTGNLITSGSNGTITNANAIFSNYVFAANGNVDLYLYTSNSYNAANAAFASANNNANSISGINLTQNNSITVALNTANAAFAQGNATAGVDTTQNTNITYAWNHANAAFAVANSGGSATDTYARNTANAAFAQANSAATITPAVFETTANGTVSTYNIGYNPISKEAVMVSIAGIVQPVSSYTVNTSNYTITFSENPQDGELVRVASFYSNANATYFQALPAPVSPSIFETTADGIVSTYNLGFNPGSAGSVLVSIGGVVQPTTTYSVNSSANTITFTEDAPANGEIIRVACFYSGTVAYVVSDQSVGFIKFDTNVSSTIINSYAAANSAFLAQNITSQYANSAFVQANAAFIISNSAFAQANAAFDAANNAVSGTVDPTARNTANAAFDTANSASDIAGAAYLKANLAYSTATTNAVDIVARNTGNAAFASANSQLGVDLSQNNRIQYAENQSNAAFDFANSRVGVDTTQNNSITAAFIQANAAWNTGNSSFDKANNNALVDVTQNNSILAAFIHANASFKYANAAFIRANNSLDANNGGTITGNLTLSQDLVVSGNLTVLGNTFSINAGTTTSTSPLYTLALNNYTTDLVDIGFIGHYNNGANTTTGLIRDAGTKEWHLFKEYLPQITANNNILIDDPSFIIDTLNANLHSTTVTIKNIDILPYANGIYNTANAAFLAANNALDTWVRGQANAAFIAANSAGSYANSAFITANAAYNAANNASDPWVRNQANSSFIQANAAFNKANSLIGFTRTTVTTTTASLAANASANATVTMAKGYVLYKIAVSTGAWVTLYSNTALANADWTRSITTDPNPGSGVIAESITTGTAANVSYYTPAVYGMNDDASVNSNGYLKIYNNSNTTNTITVTLTYLPLEV